MQSYTFRITCEKKEEISLARAVYETVVASVSFHHHPLRFSKVHNWQGTYLHIPMNT